MSLTISPHPSQIAADHSDRSISARPAQQAATTQASQSAQSAQRAADEISLSHNVTGDVSAVRQSLGRAMSIADVSLAAGDQVVGLLGQIRQIAAGAKEGGDAGASSAAFLEHLDAIEAVVSNAAFDGVNLLAGAAGDVRLAGGDDDAPQGLLSSADMTLGGPNITLTRGMGLSTPAQIDAVLGAADGSMANALSAFSRMQDEAGRIHDHDELISRADFTSATGAALGDVDAESARLRALQVRQGLAGDGVAIAQSSAALTLALFKGS